MRKVKFILTGYQRQKSKMRGLIQNVFGIDIGNSYSHSTNHMTPSIEIICTAEQFAVFLIHRNNLGITNSFKELNPKLFKGPNTMVQLKADVCDYPIPGDY